MGDQLIRLRQQALENKMFQCTMATKETMADSQCRCALVMSPLGKGSNQGNVKSEKQQLLRQQLPTFTADQMNL